MGATIRQLRMQAGYTQEELAEKLDYGHQYISRVETGVKKPSWRFLISFANLLHLPVEELLRAAGLTPAISAEDEAFMARLLVEYPELKELIDLVRRDPDEIPRMVRIIKAALNDE